MELTFVDLGCFLIAWVVQGLMQMVRRRYKGCGVGLCLLHFGADRCMDLDCCSIAFHPNRVVVVVVVVVRSLTIATEL